MGYAISPLLEEIGLNPTEYINQSFYEIEELKLRERIVPPLTSYTMTEGSLSNTGSSASTVEVTEETGTVATETVETETVVES